MEVRDEEIIKALERMSEEDQNGFSSDILDLINRQKAEIERLDKLVIYNASCCTSLHKDLFKAKSEARKEFAERLCEGRVGNDPVVIAVKVELAEMEERE